jgi:hypothetical protein
MTPIQTPFREQNGLRRLLLTSAVVGLMYAALNLLIAAMLGPLSRLQPDFPGGLMYWISGTALCVCLAPFVRHSTRSRSQTVLGIWAAIAVVRSIGTGIEGALFKPASTGQALIGLAAGIVIALFLAWLTVRLLPPAGSQPASPTLRRSSWGWAWRVLLVGLAYLVFYFGFGAANALLYTLPFYRDNPQYGLSLPPMGTILLAQLIRGPLFGIGALVLANMLAMPRRPAAMRLGLLLFVLGGLSPFVENVFLSMPLGFNLATLTELFLQNFSTGIVAAVLYKPGSGAAK